MYIPALNEINRQTFGEEPEYPEGAEDLNYIILYNEDYVSHGSDMAGNVALLVNEENAREIKHLAEEVIEKLEDEDLDSTD